MTSQPISFTLGDTQYIVWSTRSSDVNKLCPTRKKINNSGFFPPTCKRNNNIFIKKWVNHREFVYFHDEKLTLEHLFYFSSDASQIGYFILFFPPTRTKRPLSELADQTIYRVSPLGQSGKFEIPYKIPLVRKEPLNESIKPIEWGSRGRCKSRSSLHHHMAM